MRTMIALLTAVLLGLSFVSASALDYWGGPPADMWARGDSGSTYQMWDFDNELSQTPEDFDNPYGVPFYNFEFNWEWGLWTCPEDLYSGSTTSCTGWHFDDQPYDGTISLGIYNTDDPNGIKWFFIQITSTKMPSSVSVAGPFHSGTSGVWSTGRGPIQHAGPAPFGGVWYTYNYGLYLIPNPLYEYVDIRVPECTVIDQIVVDTICTQSLSSVEASGWGAIKTLLR